MTAKDELEGQRSCRSGLTGRAMEKTNTRRLMRSLCTCFARNHAQSTCRHVSVWRAHVTAADETRKTCAGMKQAVPIWLIDSWNFLVGKRVVWPALGPQC